MGKNWALKLALLVLAATGCFVVIRFAPMISFFLGSAPATVPFESGEWKRDTSSSGMFTTRRLMADDLVANHALVGRPWAEVEQLLGPPDEDPYIAPYEPSNAKIYKLAITFVDSLWLSIHVTEDGIVTSARVFED
jgi:hypothetical protein